MRRTNMRWILATSCALFALAFAVQVGAHNGLSTDELNLLQDSGGWEYLSMSDSDDGVPTTHTCFDGTPHPEQCSGTLGLTAGNTFVQNVHIHGQDIQRRGNYQLDGNQIAFFDELGTKDGPYTLELNSQNKSLVLKMPQVRIELELEKQYKADRKKAK